MCDYRGIPIFAEPGVHEACAELLLQHRPTPARVLDIAAGNGAFTQRLLDSDYSVSANDLDVAAWKLDSVRPTSVDLNEAFPDIFGQRFDAVVALEVIEHLENPSHFLRECREVLAPGGILLISIPNVADFDSRYMHLRHGEMYHFNPRNLKIGHMSILPCWLLEWHAERAGYKVLARRFVGRKTHKRWPRFKHWVLRQLFRLIMANRAGGILTASSVAYVLTQEVERDGV